MKIAYLGDTHVGSRNDSLLFNDYFEKFYTNIFFPYLKKEKIKTIIILGDVLCRRKYVNFRILNAVKKYLFGPLNDYNTHILLGNHDTYFKNTNSINSPELLLGEFDNIKIYSDPTTVDFDGTAIDIVPWISPENFDSTIDFISKSKSHLCAGHFNLKDFEMYRGLIMHEGMDRSLLNKYDMVFSGHYHHISSDGTIFYLGAPYEMTFNDYNDPRGFHIFDTNTRQLDFIQNPYRMFHKIYYDDTEMSLKEIKKIDFSNYKDTYTRIIISKKNNSYWFDAFVDRLELFNPFKVTIVEDIRMDEEDGNDVDVVNMSEDTLTLLSKHIDSLPMTGMNKDELKSFMEVLYTEAMALSE